MEELHFDFTKNATRQGILDYLMSIDPKRTADVMAVGRGAGVPDRHHHNLVEVKQTIAALKGVSEKVREDMGGVYQILAEAEATVHGCEVNETHFHEVGNGDAIRNALNICLAIEALGPNKITATRVQTGSGQIECSHGVLDIPAPATKAILDRGIPVCDEKLEGELCTPTSAALIAHFVQQFDE